MRYLAGIDIGGTKCAATLGQETEDGIKILCKEKFPTEGTPQEVLEKLADTLEKLLQETPEAKLSAIGISCGGPLDPKQGLILGPPNLPGWDHINVVKPFEEKFHVPAGVENDANACALAEWMWGAGKGTENMVFLTFGTGMGAGLILNGELYSGTNDMAGEAGHIRLAEDGPEGYGKKGSFEGFCSGGGIARMAVPRIWRWLEEGKHTMILRKGQNPETVTARDIGIAARNGDELAQILMEDTGKMLGRGVAILIDLLNPQKIVIGSIFLRQEELLREPMQKVIEQEALSYSRKVCEIVPAGLGEQLGDYAALSVAGHMSERTGKRSINL